jgi:hypothetical protein
MLYLLGGLTLLSVIVVGMHWGEWLAVFFSTKRENVLIGRGLALVVAITGGVLFCSLVSVYQVGTAWPFNSEPTYSLQIITVTVVGFILGVFSDAFLTYRAASMTASLGDHAATYVFMVIVFLIVIGVVLFFPGVACLFKQECPPGNTALLLAFALGIVLHKVDALVRAK